MSPSFSIFRFILAIIAIFVCNQQLFAWQQLSSDIDIHCEQRNEVTLICHYRPLFPGSINNVRATSRKLELPVVKSQSDSENITAIFFLIDTSDPGRQNVIEKNILQIERLIKASSSKHQLGIASFDKKLRILAPIGSSNSQLLESLNNTKAEGRTTELYRNLLLTIEKLSRTDASRKAIYLFSDGQAEDRAYFHSDVVKAARRKAIVINSFGFPRSAAKSVALQTLRRLSEETGGRFAEADKNYDLQDKLYRNPYANVDFDQTINIDLTDLANIVRSSEANITLDFATDIGQLLIKVPVSLTVTSQLKSASPALISPTIPTTPVQATIKILEPANEPEKINFWLWYALPIALVILFLIALVTLILIYRKQPDKSTFATNIHQQPKPFAYLVTQDEDAKRHPILNTTWRIGRSRDNELTLDDNSISRLHAEIHRYNNGNFFIMDMQSLNGIFINDEKVTNSKLHEGDIIEIGDIFLRFTLHTEDYQLEEDTAIQITRTPAH